MDAGYTNGPGFLAPYRGVRYHLNEWTASGNNPQTYKELFNLRHSSARNVIERAFGVIKRKWKILKDASFYPIATHVKIITTCAILYNHIRTMQPDDSDLEEVDAELRAVIPEPSDEEENEDETNDEELVFDTHVDMNHTSGDNRIRIIRTTNEWTQFRDALAQAMFAEYQNRQA